MLSVSARSATSKTGKLTNDRDQEGADIFEMAKENMLNCSPYSLYETNSGQGSAEGVRSKVGKGEGKVTRAALYPRKRPLSESRLSAPPSTTSRRELSPPELTTSDNFKPAKRVTGPKPSLEEKKKVPAVKLGSPPSPDPVNAAKMVPRLSVHVDTRNFGLKASQVGIPSNKTSSTARKSSLSGRRLSVVRLSVSKEKGMSLSPKERARETMKKVVVFPAKKVVQQTTPNNQKDVDKIHSRLVEKKAAPLESPFPFGKPRSKAVKPETVVKVESDTKHRAITRQSGSSTKALAENRKARNLSVVLRSEERLQEQNQKLELKLRELQDELLRKDREIERLRSAGLLLNNLAKNHSDEIRDLKVRLKETFNETAQVRDTCEKLEKEREEERLALEKWRRGDAKNKPLERQLASLVTRLQNIGIGVPQEFPSIELNRRSDEDQQQESEIDDEVTVDECPFEVHNEIEQHGVNKLHADDPESEVHDGSAGAREWSDATEEVTKDVPVCRHPKAPIKQEFSPVANHEELLAAIRAVQDVHDAEDNVLSNSMQNELEVIEDLQNALKVLSDLHHATEARLTS